MRSKGTVAATTTSPLRTFGFDRKAVFWPPFVSCGACPKLGLGLGSRDRISESTKEPVRGSQAFKLKAMKSPKIQSLKLNTAAPAKS